MGIKVKRQIGMVIDLNKCIGCQLCTVACKNLWTNEEGMEHMWWNSVNTWPGKGTPRDWEKMGGGFRKGKPVKGKLPHIDDFGEYWDYDYETVLYGGKGTSVYLKPKRKSKWGYNWDEDEGGGEYPNAYYFYIPRICNHCSRPACLEACPREAIYKRKEDGIVLIDEKRCKGYRFCMEACPYKKIYFNEVRGIGQKCIFCFPRIEKGTPNACARMCTGRVRFVSFRDDREGPVYKLVDKWKVALPLHPEYETEPNVFYIPPLSPYKLTPDGKFTNEMRIPMDELKKLFGQDVEKAIQVLIAEREKKKRGKESELMDILIGYRWPQDFFRIPVKK